jgi:hypothetical protein
MKIEKKTGLERCQAEGRKLRRMSFRKTEKDGEVRLLDDTHKN